MATIVRDNSGKVIGASNKNLIGKKLSDSEAKEQSIDKPKSSSKSKSSGSNSSSQSAQDKQEAELLKQGYSNTDAFNIASGRSTKEQVDTQNKNQADYQQTDTYKKIQADELQRKVSTQIREVALQAGTPLSPTEVEARTKAVLNPNPKVKQVIIDQATGETKQVSFTKVTPTGTMVAINTPYLDDVKNKQRIIDTQGLTPNEIYTEVRRSGKAKQTIVNPETGEVALGSGGKTKQAIINQQTGVVVSSTGNRKVQQTIIGSDIEKVKDNQNTFNTYNRFVPYNVAKDLYTISNSPLKPKEAQKIMASEIDGNIFKYQLSPKEKSTLALAKWYDEKVTSFIEQGKENAQSLKLSSSNTNTFNTKNRFVPDSIVKSVYDVSNPSTLKGKNTISKEATPFQKGFVGTAIGGLVGASIAVGISSVNPSFVKTVGTAFTAKYAVEGVGVASTPDNLKKYNTPEIKQAYYAARSNVERKASGENFFLGVATQVPVVNAIGFKKLYEEEFRSEISKTGLQGKQLDEAVAFSMRKLNYAEGGDVAATLVVGAASEIGGSARITSLIKSGKIAPLVEKTTTTGSIGKKVVSATTTKTGLLQFEKDIVKKEAEKLTQKIWETTPGKVWGTPRQTAKAARIADTEINAVLEKGTKKATIVKQVVDNFGLRQSIYGAAVGKEIAQYGFTEGVVEATSSDLSRTGKVNPVNTLAGGLFGAATAGVVGFGLAATSATRKLSNKAVNKVLEVGSNIVDLTEFPGDVVSRIAKRIELTAPDFNPNNLMPIGKKASTSVPTFSMTPSNSFSQSSYSGTFGGESSSPATRVQPPVKNLNLNFSPTTTATSSSTTSKVYPNTSKGASFTVQPTLVKGVSGSSTQSFFDNNVNVNTDINNSVNTNVNTNVNSNVVSNVESEVTSQVGVATDTQVGVETNVPTQVDVPTEVPADVPTEVTTTTLTTDGWFRSGKNGRSSQPGFNAYVKDKGQLVKVNSKPLSLRDAHSRAAYVADNTSSASYKVVPTKSKARTNTQISDPYAIGKFAPAKKGRYQVERNKNRIDTYGERQQITAKGLLALEKKRRRLF